MLPLVAARHRGGAKDGSLSAPALGADEVEAKWLGEDDIGRSSGVLNGERQGEDVLPREWWCGMRLRTASRTEVERVEWQ